MECSKARLGPSYASPVYAHPQGLHVLVRPSEGLIFPGLGHPCSCVHWSDVLILNLRAKSRNHKYARPQTLRSPGVAGRLGVHRCLGSYRLTLSLPEAATLLNLLPREEAAVQAALCWGLHAVLQTLQRPGQHHDSTLPLLCTADHPPFPKTKPLQSILSGNAQDRHQAAAPAPASLSSRPCRPSTPIRCRASCSRALSCEHEHVHDLRSGVVKRAFADCCRSTLRSVLSRTAGSTLMGEP